MAREAAMIVWVPVPRRIDVRERGHEAIERSDDAIATADGERAARQEVVLDVDDHECVVGRDGKAIGVRHEMVMIRA